MKDKKEVNRKFKNLELLPQSFYEQLEAKGIDPTKSTLLCIFPDGSNTYCGKLIDQHSTLHQFDLDLDNSNNSIWRINPDHSSTKRPKSSIVNMIAKEIKIIWKEPLNKKLSKMQIDISRYEKLSKTIPDTLISIEEVFPENELTDIWLRYQYFLSGDNVFPFLGTLGEAIICIGYGPKNKGKIFYFDFDFGLIPMEDENLEKFIAKLI